MTATIQSLNHTTFDLDLTIEDILHKFYGDQHNCYSNKIAFNHFTKILKIESDIGNIKVNTHDLIYYPLLNKKLRKIDHYPCLSKTVNMEPLYSSKLHGIIQSLTTLDNLLENSRNKKVQLDSIVNNLIMLNTHNKTIPIYQGKKDYYYFQGGDFQSRQRYATQIRISGVRFFIDVYRDFSPFRSEKKRVSKKHYLYNLCSRKILTDHIKYLRDHYSRCYLNNPDFERIYFLGGILNSPFLAFRCKRSYSHKGRIYHYDMHTRLLHNKKSDMLKALAHYTTQYKPDY